MKLSAPFRVKINHPDAYWISIVNGEMAMASASTSEIAFFRENGSWVVDPVAEFANYHDGSPSDASTAVYGWVPNDEIDAFLETYRA